MGKKRKKYRTTKSEQPTPQAEVVPSESPTVAKMFTYTPDPLRWAVAIILFFIGMAAYFTSFGNQFIWDDTMVITPNEYIRSWSHLKDTFSSDIHHFGLDKSNFYRPLQGVSYTIDYMFWGLKPMGFHLASALYHILNAFLVFLVVGAVLTFLDQKLKQRSRDIALGVALIWLVSPIHTQAVTYAAGRADQLVAMFILLSLLTFMQGKRVLSWMCCIGAMLSKEYGVMTPAFIFLFEYFGLTVNRESRLKKMIPYLIIFSVYAILRMTIIQFPQDVSTAFIPAMYGRLLTSVQAIMILVGLLFAPFDLSMDRNIAWANTIFDWKVMTSGTVVFAMMCGAYFLRKRQRVLSFGLLFFFVAYFPFLNIIRMNANVSEHWMYLPSIGIWTCVCYLISAKIPGMKRSLWYGLVVALCLYLSVFLIRRNADFKNEITFYNQILKRTYDNARVHYNLGCAYFFEGDMDKSRLHLMEAIRFKPDYAAAYGNLGQLEYRDGNLDRAIALYEQANKIKSDLIENRANLGTAYSDQGRFDEAIDQFQIALKLNPNHLGALNNMGIIYARMGKFDLAEKYFRAVLQISPSDQSANNNLSHLNRLQQQMPKK